jgi:hypothetical protein
LRFFLGTKGAGSGVDWVIAVLLAISWEPSVKDLSYANATVKGLPFEESL